MFQVVYDPPVGRAKARCAEVEIIAVEALVTNIVDLLVAAVTCDVSMEDLSRWDCREAWKGRKKAHFSCFGLDSQCTAASIW